VTSPRDPSDPDPRNPNGNGDTPAGNGDAAHRASAGNGTTSGNGAGNGTTPVMKAPASEGRQFGPRPMLGVPMEKSEDFRGSTARLIGMLGPERILIVLVMFLALISVTFSVFGPKILGRGTDVIVSGITSGSGIDFNELQQVLGLALGLYIISAITQYVQAWILAGAVQRTMSRLRTEVEEKLNRLPLGYVDRQPRGDLLSRVTNDIDNVAQSLQQSLSMMLTSTLTIIGTVIMMVVISPLLALVALITIPLSIFLMKGIAKRSKTRFIAQWTHTGALNAQVEEVFTGHSLVKVFGRQQEVERLFNEKNEELFQASFGAQFISGIIQPAMMFVGNLNYVLIAVIGGLRVAAGALSLGDVQAFIQYSRQFTQPLTQLASMANVMQSGIASAERVFELLDAEEESPDPVDPLRDPDPRGCVEFEHVRFSYDPENPLIEDLSLVAEPGHTIAIVGPTGAGKTTLVNLIMRFYELDGGRITLDGNDIAKMTRRELRSNVGMVLQDTWLFEGTIRENIAFGNLDATEEQIREAAKATYVDRFVHSLPDGYDTIIDDEGGTVSAGEKQLLTIARAFLADPTILILDEATSSVDTRTEVLIQRAMAALRSNRTSFVIAHRLSTIRDADTILVMEAGQIVEQGNHQELLAKGGAYYNLYNAQFAAPAAEIT
jgi:ATP-binding cassette, subfamily B, multidrug efflux pump